MIDKLSDKNAVDRKWRRRLWLSLKILAFIAGLSVGLALSALILDALFGDTGKVLYGALCVYVGHWVVPWFATESRWFK